MAFSDDERDAVLSYLGYQVSSETMTLVRTNCDRLSAASPSAEIRIKEYLRELQRIDRDINEARPFASRTFQTTQGGSAQMAPSYRMSTLRQEGRRYIGLIAGALGLPRYSDYFSDGDSGAGIVGRVRG